MLADTFHYGKRAAVRTAKRSPPRRQQKLARRCAVQHGVAGKNVAAP